MTNTTNVKQLKLNIMTQAQYDTITPSPSELYMITDAEVVPVDDAISSTSENPVQNKVVYTALNGKQDTLVSGTNIKTINNQSLLGSGNITIQGGGGGGTVDSVNGYTGTVVLTASDVGAVDLTSAQDISGRKTFLGEKAIYFKQQATSNKLGFTLYNPSNTELAALEYRPNTISGASLLALNCPQTTGGYVGFRYWGTPAVNIVAPKVATAGNYFIPTHITDGTNTVTASNTGTVNISTLLPTVGNGTITINQGGTQKGTFTVNQSGNTTINLDAGGGGGGTVDQTYDPTSANAQSGVAIAGELANYVKSIKQKQNGYTAVVNSGSNIDLIYNDNYHFSELYLDANWTQLRYNDYKLVVNANGFELLDADNSATLTIPNGNLAVNGTEVATQTWVTNQGYLTSIPSNYLQNTATATNSLTILGTTNNQNNSILIGYGTTTSSTNSTVIGNTAVSGGSYATALGYYARANDQYTTAIGHGSYADYQDTTAVGHNSQATAAGTLAVGSNSKASAQRATSIGYSSQATQYQATALGYEAKATANSALQIGTGTNSTANTLQVGSYTLLNTSTGLIPDARISSNIARTSDVADTSLSNLSTTGQAIIDGKADTTLSNVSSIDSSSAVQTALDAKVNNDDYYYKSGDTDSYFWFGGGYISAGATEIAFTLPTPKSMANVTTVTCTALTTAFRKSNGGYMPSSGGNVWNALANATVTISKQTEKTLYISVKYKNWGGTNNTPVGVWASISLSFT